MPAWAIGADAKGDAAHIWNAERPARQRPLKAPTGLMPEGVWVNPVWLLHSPNRPEQRLARAVGDTVIVGDHPSLPRRVDGKAFDFLGNKAV